MKKEDYTKSIIFQLANFRGDAAVLSDMSRWLKENTPDAFEEKDKRFIEMQERIKQMTKDINSDKLVVTHEPIIKEH